MPPKEVQFKVRQLHGRTAEKNALGPYGPPFDHSSVKPSLCAMNYLSSCIKRNSAWLPVKTDPKLHSCKNKPYSSKRIDTGLSKRPACCLNVKWYVVYCLPWKSDSRMLTMYFCFSDFMLRYRPNIASTCGHPPYPDCIL